MSEGHGVNIDFDGSVTKRTVIRSFAEIPDILTLEVPPADYIVPALDIARGTVTLWTGADGDGKTFMAQSMGVAIATGQEFLGIRCQQTPVLYVDLENPPHVVQARMRMLAEIESIPNLRVWGIWNEHQPPRLNDATLLQIAKDTRPVVIIDPLRFFHDAKENDSTEMAAVMQSLKGLARYGCAVIVLHHPAKTEGSTGRGSSAIRGHSDLALLHSLDKDAGLITLTIDKNRNGGSNRKMTVRADFENGRFEVTDSPYLSAAREKMTFIEQIIGSNPGMSQQTIFKAVGGNKSGFLELLTKGVGSRWHTKPGPRNAKLYYLGKAVSLVPEQLETTGTGQETSSAPVSPVPPPLEETGVQVADRTLPSCTKCGSFALYRDGSCMTCE
jgi:hypothetical protein